MIASDVESAEVSEIAREIASQPACWGQAARQGAQLAGALPSPRARVGAVGCGTSLYVAQAYAALRESRTGAETDAYAASEAPADRAWDAVVAISRSGTTTEVARFLETTSRTPRIAIVGVTDTPVAAASDELVDLSFADERSVVQTRFATSALALLRASVGEDLGVAIADAERALEAPLPLEPAAHDHYVFLGTGWSVGLANEAALKLREAAGAWSESYPAMEYRHGPISVARTGSVVWSLGDVDPSVLEDVERTGATVVTGTLDPMAELILIQRTAVALAEHRGLEPDHPRHLTRSVVLS
jgi:fructoselysine-6-P-deglycase FrlB-like protein